MHREDAAQIGRLVKLVEHFRFSCSTADMLVWLDSKYNQSGPSTPVFNLTPASTGPMTAADIQNRYQRWEAKSIRVGHGARWVSVRIR